MGNADEEALFDVWFELYRERQWKVSRPDRAHEPPTAAFIMGLRSSFHIGWMARAGLHVIVDGSTSSDAP